VSPRYQSRLIGQDGIHIFKIAGASISGWSPFWKGEPTGRQAMPFTSEQEDRAALAMLFDPRIAYAQRADVTGSFVAAHRLAYRLPVPYTVSYDWSEDEHEVAGHDYYLDFMGILANGRPFTAEAGRVADKSQPQERAKAEAARHYMAQRSGSFYLITGLALSEMRIENYRWLRAHHRAFREYDEIAPELETLWLEPEPRAIGEVVDHLGPRHGRERVEAAAWRRACLAAIDGRLLVDLDSVQLTLETPVALMPGDAPSILPPELPSQLPEAQAPGTADEAADVIMPGPTVDETQLPPEKAAVLRRNRSLTESVAKGMSIDHAAANAGISTKQARRVLNAASIGGESALVPHARRAFTSRVHPIYAQTILRLLRSKRRLKVRSIRESAEMRQAYLEVRKLEGQAVPLPSRFQIYRLRDHLKKSDPLVDVRLSGKRHPERSATAVRRYVFSIPAPGLVCQVDEHKLDVLITLDGQEITSRVWCACLVCVKTGAILGAVVSPAELTEEDYMRLVKQALEPKDSIVNRYGCEFAWPCAARPAEILTDRGWIFRSEHARSVVVDRLGITQKAAPPLAPDAKGIIEAVFRFMTERFAHRFPSTTMGSPAARGQHDPEREARRSGMTLSQFEAYFFRAIVDGYMQDWDELRGGPRWQLWQDAVKLHGVPRWLGSSDELKLLLMRAHNVKHPKGHYPVHKNGVSFKGHWYVGHDGLTARLKSAGEASVVYWDKRDLTTIYLADSSGNILGAATTQELGQPPVSLWERDARRRTQAGPRAQAREISSTSLTDIFVDEARGRGGGRRAERGARQRALRAERHAADIEDVHSRETIEERERLARRLEEERAGIIDLSSRLPGARSETAKARRPQIEYLPTPGRSE
jgi:transposase